MQTVVNISKDEIFGVLRTVKDPEIDTVSIVDLGMIDNIKIEENHVTVLALPTFLGCPALEIIERDIVNAVSQIPGVKTTNVKFIYHPPWTSDRITKEGHQGLRAFGIAPPPRQMEEDGSWYVECPFCGSASVTLDNLFGPTACRSILYCKSCKNPFEAMKPVSNI